MGSLLYPSVTPDRVDPRFVGADDRRADSIDDLVDLPHRGLALSLCCVAICGDDWGDRAQSRRGSYKSGQIARCARWAWVRAATSWLVSPALTPLIYEDTDLVFAQENGRPYDPSTITKEFKRLSRDAELRHVKLHGLRHGSASLMLAAGIPIEIVSKRLGHSSFAITHSTYSDLLEGVGRHAAEAAMGLVPRREKHAAPNLLPTPTDLP
jgi:hypothetical protein